MTTPDQLSLTFFALADPTRRAILERLSVGEATLTQLAEPFKMTLPAVAKHIRILERAGLLTRSQDAQRRPCRLQPEPLVQATDWLQEYRRLWEDRFDRLDVLLDELNGDT